MTNKYQGRGLVQITGRHHGKSQMAAYARLFDDIFNSPVKVSEIKLSEGTVYGARYYTAEPIGGNWRVMLEWSIETFGPGNASPIWGEAKAPKPAERWYVNNSKFWFRELKDRDWFILRWSS